MKLFDKIFKSHYELLELGNDYFYGINGKEVNLHLAYEYFLKAAKKGNQTAVKLIASTFVPGKPELKEDMTDIYKLMKCMRLAVEAGDPQACFFYGVGKLSPESDDYMYKKGLNWVKQAAEMDFPPAMHAYGLELLKGNRIPQDKAIGMDYIKKAALKGETTAISLLYSLGEHDFALDALNRHVSDQNPKAIALLAEIKLRERNYKEGITLMEQAASLNDKNAMFNIAVIFDNGKYCKKDPYKAAMWYQKAANLGDAQSMENLGYLLEQGPEELRNEKAAFDLYKKAAENGLHDAWNDVATCYKRGIGIEQSAKKAQEYYLKAAEFGNPEKAYYNLFMLFMDGIACNPDYEEALKWITKAAEMDLPEACWQLGKLYEMGLGVEKDPNKAFRWFNIAADKGEPHAMLEIGRMYLDGIVVDREARKGYEYIKKASGCLVEAMRTLGHCYVNGWGCRQDYDLAFECYSKAANAGDPDAQYDLGLCYRRGEGVAQDFSKAIEWYEKAIKQGHAGAMVNYAILLDTGTGVETDLPKAFELYKKAAEAGNPEAQFCIGDMYFKGRFVEQNYQEAAKWFSKAAVQGEPDSLFHLFICYHEGLGVEKNIPLSIKYLYASADRGWQPAIQVITENCILRPKDDE